MCFIKLAQKWLTIPLNVRLVLKPLCGTDLQEIANKPKSNHKLCKFFLKVLKDIMMLKQFFLTIKVTDTSVEIWLYYLFYLVGRAN